MHPHIYKDGQIISFKQLDEGTDTNPTQFCFSGSTGNKSITTLISSTNNLNQITGRILLGVFNLLSYFGISKDPSEESKTSNVFRHFHKTFLREEEAKKNNFEEIKILLKKQIEKSDLLEAQLNNMFAKRNDVPISRDEVLNFTSKLTEIEVYLKKILG